MNISDDAVEAGAKILWAKSHDMRWESAADAFKGPYFRDAREVLEAAAQHLDALK